MRRYNTISSKMFRVAQNFDQQLKLPAKPLICVELRLDLASLEDVFEGYEGITVLNRWPNSRPLASSAV
jgi:hypothetical protein